MASTSVLQAAVTYGLLDAAAFALINRQLEQEVEARFERLFDGGVPFDDKAMETVRLEVYRLHPQTLWLYTTDKALFFNHLDTGRAILARLPKERSW